jgi:hypothetical protein
VNSGIAIYRSYGDYIIPVPCLLDIVLKVLRKVLRGSKLLRLGLERLRLFRVDLLVLSLLELPEGALGGVR